MRILGICNLHDGPSLGLLTENRPLGATTFLGRYGLMDFTLSNFSNSGIDRVDILVEKNFQAIKNHVKDGSAWINNTKTGFQKLYFNEKVINSPKFNTDIANIIANKICLKEDGDLVVIAPAFFIALIDYRDFIEKHLKSGADVSVIYSDQEDAGKLFCHCDSVTLNKKSMVEKFSLVNDKDKKCNVSLETFILSKEKFNALIDLSKNLSSLMSFRQVVTYATENKIISLCGLKFDGYVVPILSFDHFVNQSFDLLFSNNKVKLYKEDWPIYTTIHNTPPTLYDENAFVKNCFVANGSVIKGHVENSIISRNVVIEKGAVVKNCILFTNTKVDSNICLENVVCDKSVHFAYLKDVKGKKEEVLFVPFGETI